MFYKLNKPCHAIFCFFKTLLLIPVGGQNTEWNIHKNT